ncbi:MAG: methyltransferase domain-containing protein [Deltaproteobacteria bacterium]|nr:methyltransferase domain-containing protein [Deltaproteobacteria bacterium]
MSVEVTAPDPKARKNTVQILEEYWRDHPAWFGRPYGEYLHLGANQEMLRILLGGLAIGPTTKVLDLGCALGGNARWLASLYGSSVDGVDPFAPAIQVAKRLSRAQSVDALCQFTVGKLDALDMPAERFDLVLTADDDVEWSEVARVLKKSGHAVGSHVATGGISALESALKSVHLAIDKLVDITAYARAFYRAKEEEAKLLVDAGLMSKDDLLALSMHTVDLYDAGACSHALFRAKKV